jgi:type I restriction enzyme S subunit
MNSQQWEERSLGSLVEIQSGRLNSDEAVSNGLYPFFTCAREVLRIDRFEHDREAVLVGGNNANALFPVFYCRGKFTARQRVYVIWSRDPAELDNRYLFFVLQTATAGFGQMSLGTTTKFITLGMLTGLPVRLPPISIQRAIVDVLGSLDDKIEQNHQTGRSLEELARVTFKAWFVDFEPVKAKAAGQTSFPGVPPAAFAALPNRMTDSPIGQVPQGWEVRPLSKVADFLNGLALQKYPPVGDETDLPVIKIADLRKGSTEGGALASAGVPSAYVVDDGDLLFSWSGTLEVELWFGGRGALNQHLFKVTSDTYPRWLCLHWVRQHLPEFRLIASSKATTMGHIKRSHLDAAHVVVPDVATLAAAEDMMNPIYKMVTNLAIESRRLTTLRDYLLPRLLSGRVRVRA